MSKEKELTINDLKEFYADNDMIMETLEKSSTELTEVLTNSMLIKASAEQMTNLETSLINIRYQGWLNEFNETASTLNEQIDDLATSYAKDAQNVAGWLVFAERRINGYISDEEAKNILDQLMEGLSNNNAFWLVQAAIQGAEFQGLSGLLAYGAASSVAYGTDTKYGGAVFTIGDGTSAFLEKLGFTKAIYKDFKLMNTALGSGIVVVFTIASQTANDKGSLTDRDKSRYYSEGIKAGVNYFVWTAIVGVGGLTLPVVAVAAGTTMLLSALWDEVVGEHITGDKIVDEYDSFILEKDGTNEDGTPKYKYKYEYRREDGTTYFAEEPENANDTKVTIAIPKNGSGKDGTYDVLIEKYEEKSNLQTNSLDEIAKEGKLASDGKTVTTEYSLNGEKCTEQYYKEKLYNDWEEVCPDVKEKYSKQDLESFNKFLNDVKNASSQEEREKLINDFERIAKAEESYPGHNGDYKYRLYNELKKENFDIKEYMIYQDLNE